MVLDEDSKLDRTMFSHVLLNTTDTGCWMRSLPVRENGKIATKYEFLIVSCFERIKFIY